MASRQKRGLDTEGPGTALNVLPTVGIYPLSMLGITVLFLETGVQRDYPPFQGHTPCEWWSSDTSMSSLEVEAVLLTGMRYGHRELP